MPQQSSAMMCVQLSSTSSHTTCGVCPSDAIGRQTTVGTVSLVSLTPLSVIMKTTFINLHISTLLHGKGSSECSFKDDNDSSNA